MFIAILGVALICVLASALLSNYLAHRQIGQFVQEHESELTATVPTDPYQYSNPPSGQYPPPNQDPSPNPPPKAPPPLEPRNINLGFILAGLLGLVLALALGFLLAGRMSKPLDDLTAATGKISGGDYQERVEIKGGKEVEELGVAFNSLAESLQRNEELRQHMVADIAHELRNPLATLRGQLELMQDGKVVYNKEAIDSLVEDAVLLSRIVDDLSQLSLVDAGKLEFRFQEVDAGLIIAEVKSRFEHEAAARSIEVNLDLRSELPQVLADPARLAQVLGNLEANAIAHTPPGGTITISAERRGDRVTFSVTDTGSGIPPEDLPHVFDRFYRTDKSRSRETGGAGLGLSIAKSLVEAQGGVILAESVCGEGTRMSFEIPISRA